MTPTRTCILVALLTTVTTAGEEDRPASREITISKVRQLEAISDERWGKAFAFIGHVTIEVRGMFRLRAQRGVVWLDPRADVKVFELFRGLRDRQRRVPLWAIRSLYAEGGRAPAVFHTAGRVFRCSSLFYDFQRQRGLLVDAELRLRRRGQQPDLVLRAKRMRALGPGHWTGEKVRIFSSDYYEPQVSLHVERVELRDKRVAEAVGELTRLSDTAQRKGEGVPQAELEAVIEKIEGAALDFEGKSLDLHSLTARVFRFPFLAWPRIRTDQDSLARLRIEADVGGRGRLGTGVRLGAGIESKPVGFLVGVGYFGGRGPLVDLEVVVNAFDGALRGRSFGVYLRDHGRDRGGSIPSTPDRYWVKNQYRWLISDGWRLDAEYADLSDANWLITYDEREFKEGKEQETLLYLRGRGRLGYLALTGKTRAISFLPVLEESPRLVGSLPVLTLVRLGPETVVQLAGHFELSNLRLRPGDPNPGPDLRTGRIDLDPTLFLAFNVGRVRVVPHAEFRFTGYENSVGGDSLGRFAGTAGVRADIQLSRWFGRTRHVVNVAVEYENLYALTQPSSRLFPFDVVDRVSPFEAVTIRIRNRLQRRTEGAPETFLSFEIFGAWFPDREQPLGRMGDGLIELDLAWWYRDRAGLSMRANMDPEDGQLDTGSLEGWWRPRPLLRVGAGIRHLEGDSDVVTFSAEREVDTRWRLVLFSQVDARSGDFLDQSLLIQRLGQTAVFSLRIGFDPGDDNFNVAFKLDLLQAFRQKQARRRRDAVAFWRR